MKKLRKMMAFLLVLCLLFSVVPMNMLAAQERTEPAAEPADGPLKIVFLDCGRKYFSPENLKKLIDTAYSAGLNAVGLGIGNDGLRLMLDDMSVGRYTHEQVRDAVHEGNLVYNMNCAKYWSDPNYGSVSYDNYVPEVNELTQAQMDDVISYANGKGIQIIPLINTPGHMNAIVTAMEYLGIRNPNAEGRSANTMNLLGRDNQTVLEFTKGLIQNYVDYFAAQGCRYFNMGMDEYANDINDGYGFSFGKFGNDSVKWGKFVAYMNDIAGRIKAAGMTPICFNDGLYFFNSKDYPWGDRDRLNDDFDPDIMVSYWTTGWNGYDLAYAQTIAEQGHPLINTNSDYYWVVGKPMPQYQCPPEKAAGFQINHFTSGYLENPAGAMFCIWSDFPSAMTEQEILDQTAESILAYGRALPGGSKPKPNPVAPQGEQLVIPHTQTTGETNKFTFSQRGWTAGDEEHVWTDIGKLPADEVWYTVEFEGNAIEIFAGKNRPMGFVKYYIDDEFVGECSLYNDYNIQSTHIATFSGLTEGHHTFKAIAAGKWDTKSIGCEIDCAQAVVWHQPYEITDLKVTEPAEGRLELVEGTGSRLNVEITPSYISASEVLFVSDHPEIVSVNPDGSVEALAPGEAVITVSPKNENSPAQAVMIPVQVRSSVVPEQPFRLAGSSVVLESSLKMRFAVNTADLKGETDVYAQITKRNPDGSRKVTTAAYGDWLENSDGSLKYVEFNQLSAKEMADQLEVVICDREGRALSEVYTTSIQDYAKKALKDPKHSDMYTLLVDMLNYGAAAQVNFQYNMGNPANGFLTADQQKLATQNASAADRRTVGENYFTTTLSLDNRIILNLYFKNITPEMYAVVRYVDHYGEVKENRISGSRFKQSGTDGVLSVSVDTLAVADGDRLVSCTVYDTGDRKVAEVSDSVEGYAARALEKSSNQNLNHLIEMLVKFSHSSAAFFAKK